ncbi:hypothetical protein ACVWWK_000354 [Bradyrhizobium sp. LB9.1b]
MKTTDAYRWINSLRKTYPQKFDQGRVDRRHQGDGGLFRGTDETERESFRRNKSPKGRSERDEGEQGRAQNASQEGLQRERSSDHPDGHARDAEPSDLGGDEGRQALAPWLCAYSGARANELTSLHPYDITEHGHGIRCMVIKPSLEKTEQWRVVPIHSHILEQPGFLEYVEERRKLNKPLFYDPERSRGGKAGNPQFKKVAERIGEWVHGLGIPKGVKPNHAWRHLFKSVARHVKMDREVEAFITGHRPKDANAGIEYGDPWVKTMYNEIERYPRFQIEALGTGEAGIRKTGNSRPFRECRAIPNCCGVKFLEARRSCGGPSYLATRSCSPGVP